MKTLKILRVFFRNKWQELKQMGLRTWCMWFIALLFLICLGLRFKSIQDFLTMIAPFVWGIWLLQGFVIFIRFLYSNWKKAKREVEQGGV